MRWGKLPYDEPDVCYAWGGDCSKRDMVLLHCHVASRGAGELSLLKELEARGYDLTTLKFSIQKKATTS